MKRLIAILGCALLVGVLSFSVYTSYRGPQLSQHEAVFEDLRWLRAEFDLDREQYAEIERLYEAYRPVCEELCLRVMRVQEELKSALAQATEFNPEMADVLDRYTRVKQECHQAMLRHVYDVAGQMEPEQRDRYLKRAILHVTMHDPVR